MEKKEYIRAHFTNSENLIIQEQERKQNWFKPLGFWYEIDNSWEQWVSNEMPDWLTQRYPYKFRIEIDLTNILVIDTPEKFIKFHEEFSGREKPDDYYRQIDWPLVSQVYDGIEITRYFHQFRMEREYNWYYPWDVASGCIWRNYKCITVKEPLERTTPVYNNYDENYN